MPKVSHNTLIILSGIVWFAVGCFLMQLGLKLLVNSMQQMPFMKSYPLVDSLVDLGGSRQTIVLLMISLGLYIGFLKGRYVLGKSVKKSVARILEFSNPTSLGNIYSARYYILLAIMVGIGLSIKYLGLSDDIRGFIDVTIGAALINGAMVYFQSAREIKTRQET